MELDQYFINEIRSSDLLKTEGIELEKINSLYNAIFNGNQHHLTTNTCFGKLNLPLYHVTFESLNFTFRMRLDQYFINGICRC